MGFSLKKLGQRIVAQANPFDNGRTYQHLAPTTTGSVGQQASRQANHVATGIGLGGLRSFTGTAQGLSGLYDLATPGLGTSRVSKGLNNLAQQTDATAKAEHISPLIYKGSQGATDALTFLTPGALAKGTSFAGKVGVANKSIESVMAARTAGLASKGFGGRVAARTVQNVAKPGYQAVNAGFTALQSGKEASQGKQVTPQSVATNLVVGGVGFPAAGAVTHEVAAPIIKGVSKTLGKVSLKSNDAVAHTGLLTDNAEYGQLQKQLEQSTAAANKINQNNGSKVALGQHTKNIANIQDQMAQMRRTYSQAGGRNTTANVSSTDPAGIPRSTPEAPAPVQSPVDSLPNNTQSYLKELDTKQKVAAEGPTNRVANAQQTGAIKAVDALSPIEKPVTQALGRTGALPLRNQLDRSLRSATIAGQYAQDNGLHTLIQSVPDTKAFDQYVIAKHAADLEAQGINTGRNLVKDQQLIHDLAPKFEGHAQQLTDYNHKLLDTATNYGLISRETADFLKAKYPNYVPMNRVFTEAELKAAKGTGSGPASLSTQTIVQRINGSAREVASPLESVLAKTHDTIAQGERNRAAQMLSAYKDLPGNPLGLRELAPGETIGVKPTISFLDNGVQRTFETTPEVANAAKSLNKEQLGFVGQIFSAQTRLLRLGATSANPAFALANVVKDTASGFINSEHPFQASIANPKVFLQAMSAAVHHGGKQYGELVREGAGGTSFDIARNAANKTLEQVRADRNIGSKALYTVRNPKQLLRAVEDTIGRSEEFNRAIQYYGNKNAVLKSKGEVFAKAYGADAARNNTVNFARAGEYGRTLNAVFPYLNAGVQGSRTLLRNLKERPTETGTKIVMTAFVPVAAATAWNLNDPKRKAAYDSISEYEKQNNIIIVPPNPKQDAQGRWNVIKIPTSQEIANLNNIVRNGVESMQKDKNFDFGALAGNLTGTATSLNAQSPRQIANQLTPQAGKPIAEVALNQNLFTGQQIVPDAQKNLDKKDQVNNGTSGTARVIGRLTNTSPLQIDNAIRTSTGGGGQNIINATDTALAKAGVIKPDQVRGKSIPTAIANRFNSAQGQTSGSQYYGSIQDAAKKSKLAGKDYELLNAILAKEVDGNGNAIPQSDKSALNTAQILANNPKVAAVKAQAAKDLAKKTGKPLDPLYDLTPDQQTAYYKMQGSIYKGQQYERVVKENPWITKFTDTRTAYFDSLNLKNPTVSGKVKYPLNKQEQNTLDGYFAISDPTQRGQAIQNNPQISTALNKLSKYANDKQIAQGSAPLDTYPQSTPQVEQWSKEYFAQPKGTKTAWQRANPGKWQAVSQQLTAQSLYGLQNDAVAAQYKDTGLSQKGLKDLYTLGKYDVQKGTDANGNTFYALGSSSGGSGGSSKYASGGGSSATYGTLNPNKYAVSLKAGGSAPKSTKVAKVSKNLKYKVALKSSPSKISVKKSKV